MAWNFAAAAMALSARFLLAVACLPYAVYLLLPLAAAIAWISIKKHFCATGEWLSFFLHGWRPRRVAAVIVLITFILLLIMQAISQNKTLASYQLQQVRNSQILMSHDKLVLNNNTANIVFTDKNKELIITRWNKDNSLEQSIFTPSAKGPKYQLSIAATSLPIIPPKLNFAYYDKFAMFCLLCNMLLFAIYMPFAFGYYSAFIASLLGLVLYTLNLQIMHWLHKVNLSEEFAPLAFLFVMSLLIRFLRVGKYFN